MKVNPVGLILIVIGFVAVIVGVNGTQSAVWALFTGKAPGTAPQSPQSGLQAGLGGLTGGINFQGVSTGGAGSLK